MSIFGLFFRPPPGLRSKCPQPAVHTIFFVTQKMPATTTFAPASTYFFPLRHPPGIALLHLQKIFTFWVDISITSYLEIRFALNTDILEYVAVTRTILKYSFTVISPSCSPRRCPRVMVVGLVPLAALEETRIRYEDVLSSAGALRLGPNKLY